jgi:hypothetical protein
VNAGPTVLPEPRREQSRAMSRKAGKAELSLLRSHARKSSTGRTGRVSTGRSVTPWKRRLEAAAGTRAAPSPALTNARMACTWPMCCTYRGATPALPKIATSLITGIGDKRLAIEVAERREPSFGEPMVGRESREKRLAYDTDRIELAADRRAQKSYVEPMRGECLHLLGRHHLL